MINIGPKIDSLSHCGGESTDWCDSVLFAISNITTFDDFYYFQTYAGLFNTKTLFNIILLKKCSAYLFRAALYLY